MDQSNAYVRSKLKEWVHDVVKTYGFDSIRIDTVPYVSKDFWTEYTRAAGVSYSIGEVFNGNAQFVAGYQSTMSALFNYPLYYKLLDAYKYKKSMYKIREAVIQNAVFSNAGILGLFVDNHDNNRFLSGNTDVILLKNALTYILFAEVNTVYL